ncbi:hypothetical protein PV08_06569 [Exophiala spinifera]|uniref:Transcription factor domain-containing protein n=1 Tax=Exophiala spinifera TaxID=91928 RepID=A0A0D2BZ02_9EURO|nr:uncharacterized protein PV08_06569 [Exophiala spinifera]KIW16514.1 hypothetical protein PV08_06569 [Exophiala spinifera]
MLCHMNQCILHHPYLFRKRLQSFEAAVPLSFITEILRRSFGYAEQLISTVRAIQELGMAISSFYGYPMVVGGVICKLFSYHNDIATRNTAKRLYRHTLEFLDQGRSLWGHYPKMAIALEQFKPDPLAARELVTASRSTELSDDPSFHSIEHLLDYGWLSDPARSISLATNVADPLHHIWFESSASSDDSSVSNGKDCEVSGISEVQQVRPLDQNRFDDGGDVVLKDINFGGEIHQHEGFDMDLINHLELPMQDFWDNSLGENHHSFPLLVHRLGCDNSRLEISCEESG